MSAHDKRSKYDALLPTPDEFREAARFHLAAAVEAFNGEIGGAPSLLSLHILGGTLPAVAGVLRSGNEVRDEMRAVGMMCGKIGAKVTMVFVSSLAWAAQRDENFSLPPGEWRASEQPDRVEVLAFGGHLVQAAPNPHLRALACYPTGRSSISPEGERIAINADANGACCIPLKVSHSAQMPSAVLDAFMDGYVSAYGVGVAKEPSAAPGAVETQIAEALARVIKARLGELRQDNAADGATGHGLGDVVSNN